MGTLGTAKAFAVAFIDIGVLQPVASSPRRSRNLRDLTQRRLAFTGHRDDIIAELLRIRLA